MENTCVSLSSQELWTPDPQHPAKWISAGWTSLRQWTAEVGDTAKQCEEVRAIGNSSPHGPHSYHLLLHLKKAWLPRSKMLRRNLALQDPRNECSRIFATKTSLSLSWALIFQLLYLFLKGPCPEEVQARCREPQSKEHTQPTYHRFKFHSEDPVSPSTSRTTLRKSTRYG